MMQRRLLNNSVLIAGLLAGLLTLSACNTSPMAPSMSNLSARLSGAQEVPPGSSTASGLLVANLNRQTRQLTWTVDYTPMSGPATGGHFHGPAAIGQNAGVAVPFSGSLDSPIRGSATLTEAQMADLVNGRWYVNLHTAANPGGEIRGQVALSP